jgi:hypothetical protein
MSIVIATPIYAQRYMPATAGRIDTDERSRINNSRRKAYNTKIASEDNFAVSSKNACNIQGSGKSIDASKENDTGNVLDTRNHGRRRLYAGNSREPTTVTGASGSPDAFTSKAAARTGIGRSSSKSSQ